MTFLTDLLFKSTPTYTHLRKIIFILGGLTFWLLSALLLHPPEITATLIKTAGMVFGKILSQITGGEYLGNWIDDLITLLLVIAMFIWQLLKALFAPDIFRHIIVLGLPIYIAYRAAILYMDDVYELNDQRTAFEFLRAAIFGIRPYTMTIEKGAVAAEDQYSPLLAIGGPGEVQVNMENVAVFDRITGDPHIVGPTMDRINHREFLGSFERLRNIIDLRDQMTRSNELAVEGRSRDGIPVVIRDVRLVFSVQRDGKQAQGIYTYQEEAVIKLVYHRPPGAWTASMTRLVRRHLQNFITTHTLSEILAAVGQPETGSPSKPVGVTAEMEALFPQANTDFQANSQPVNIVGETPPTFIPRLRFTDLFYENRPQGFQTQARQRGVQLQWIDVGTLWVPPGPIPELQMETWQTMIENSSRNRSLENQESEIRLVELARLIHITLLDAYTKSIEEGKAESSLSSILIAEHLKLLEAARDAYRQDEMSSPPRIEDAIQFTYRCLEDYLKENGQAR